MRNLAQWAISLPFAAPLVGAREMGRIMGSWFPSENGGTTEVSSDLNPGRYLYHGFQFMGRCVEMAEEAVGDWEQGWYLREFSNKLYAFGLFEQVERHLGLPDTTDFSLSEAIARVRAWDGYSSVWGMEGLGYAYGERCWRKDGSVHFPQDVPQEAMMALHVGMGQLFAGKLFADLGYFCSDQELHNCLQRFLTLCRKGARRGYVDAAIESLGALTRLLYPSRLYDIDRLLMTVDEDLVALFWHGVGRGAYFTPSNAMPVSLAAAKAAASCLRDAPHELGRKNALAGVVWATTLVNIRHPEIVAMLLEYLSGQCPPGHVFSNGVASALLIWQDSVPGDPNLKTFLDYDPGSNRPELARLWESHVSKPCEGLLTKHYPALKRQGRLSDVFHYQQTFPSIAPDVEIKPRQDGTGMQSGLEHGLDAMVSQILHGLCRAPGPFQVSGEFTKNPVLGTPPK